MKNYQLLVKQIWTNFWAQKKDMETLSQELLAIQLVEKLWPKVNYLNFSLKN